MTPLDQWLATLQSRLGQEFAVGDWLQIDQARIDAFAAATGDTQWIHTDPVRAASDSPYGRTLAHGFLTLSLLPLLTAGNDPQTLQRLFPGAKLRVNYGLNRLRFPAPVLCGESIRARTLLLAARIVGEALEVTWQFTIEIEGKEKPALVAEQLVRVYA
jgi:acyl dehydratase